MTESKQKKKVDISLQIFPGKDFAPQLHITMFYPLAHHPLRGELCSVPSSLTKSITRQLPWTAHEISAYINTLNYTS